MSNAEVESRIDTFVDSNSHVESAVLGLIDEEEFAWAQTVVPDLNEYLDFDDWLDSREGFQIGLAMAGIDAKIERLSLRLFLTWCRLSGSAPSERTLDVFAAMRAAFREAPAAIAVIRRGDFELHGAYVAALAPYNNYEAWLRHRETERRSACPAVKDFPIHLGDFIAWTRCLGESTSEASLDAYASLVAEYITQRMEK